MMEPMRGAVDCEQRCEIPAGKTLTDMPPSRHAWSDIVRCPNDGCGRTFLVQADEKMEATQDSRADRSG